MSATLYNFYSEVINKLPAMKRVFIVPQYELPNRQETINIIIGFCVFTIIIFISSKIYTIRISNCTRKQKPQAVTDADKLAVECGVDETSCANLESEDDSNTFGADELEGEIIPDTQRYHSESYTSGTDSQTGQPLAPISQKSYNYRYNVRDERGRFTKRALSYNWDQYVMSEPVTQARKSKNPMTRISVEMALEMVAE